MTLAAFAHSNPRIFDWGIRLDRAPARAWIALQLVALAPVWIGMVQHLRGGSLASFVLLALALLAPFGWTRGRKPRTAPRLGWLALAAAGSLVASVLGSGIGSTSAWAPLAAGALAVLAVAAGLTALLPVRVATPCSTPALDRFFANRFVNRILHKAVFGVAMLMSLACSATAFWV